MENEQIIFPQYRKHANGKHLYKITDEKRFQEIQFIGSKKVLFRFKATKYPEMLRVKDMLAGIEPYLQSNESEWEQIFSSLEK